jgi:hypothetical protein
MKIVEVFAVNEQVEHVVTLPAHLQSHFQPVKRRCLKKLGRLK